MEAERKLKETPTLIKLPSGYIQPSPWLAIANKQLELILLDAVRAFLWSSDMGSHTSAGDEPERETAQSFIGLIYETADYIRVAVIGDRTWDGLARAGTTGVAAGSALRDPGAARDQQGR